MICSIKGDWWSPCMASQRKPTFCVAGSDWTHSTCSLIKSLSLSGMSSGAALRGLLQGLSFSRTWAWIDCSGSSPAARTSASARGCQGILIGCWRVLRSSSTSCCNVRNRLRVWVLEAAPFAVTSSGIVRTLGAWFRVRPDTSWLASGDWHLAPSLPHHLGQQGHLGW